jgi:hypothetical protein
MAGTLFVGLCRPAPLSPFTLTPNPYTQCQDESGLRTGVPLELKHLIKTAKPFREETIGLTSVIHPDAEHLHKAKTSLD